MGKKAKKAGTRKPDATLDPEAAASEKADTASHARASADASKEAAEGAAAAKAAASAVQDSAPAPSDDKGRVNEPPSGSGQLKALWKQHKRHLFVAASILSQDGMRHNVAMILEVCRAVWTQHSSDAHTIRSPVDTFQSYLIAARRGHYKVLEESASVLLDLVTLKSVGFLTDFGGGIPAGTSVTSDTVQSQTAHAYTLVQLLCDTTFHRITSMMWHSHSWFGLPALLGSDDVNDLQPRQEDTTA